MTAMQFADKNMGEVVNQLDDHDLDSLNFGVIGLAVSRPKRNTWLINLVGCPLG
jgi:hypothetical protein